MVLGVLATQRQLPPQLLPGTEPQVTPTTQTNMGPGKSFPLRKAPVNGYMYHLISSSEELYKIDTTLSLPAFTDEKTET